MQVKDEEHLGLKQKTLLLTAIVLTVAPVLQAPILTEEHKESQEIPEHAVSCVRKVEL